MRPVRNRNPRPRKTRVLIWCEGKMTEPTYLNGLYREQGVRDHFMLDIRRGSGGDALVTVTAARNERNRQRQREEPYDEVWCVLDVESRDRAKRLEEAIVAAKREGIQLALSNPSFEVWLIAHFQRIAQAFLDSSAAETFLTDRCWRVHFGCAYEKGASDLYTRLAPNVDAAIQNAQWVLEQHHSDGECKDCNSATEVYRLVSRLRSLPSP